MKVSYSCFGPDVPTRKLYRRGVDFLQHEFDLKFEDILYLLGDLKNHRSSLRVEAPSCSVELYVEYDGSLWVEIYGDNGLWAVNEVDVALATEILRLASEGEGFGTFVPTTGKEWAAYSIIGQTV